MKSLSNNLFNYATSELSQDAFICYLVSFLLEENVNKNEELNKCAVDFVNVILPKEANIEYRVPITNVQGDNNKQAINKQYKNINVYLIVNGYHIIIEDKTFTYSHDNQIDRYTDTLIEEGIPKEEIIRVYYKIVEQSEKEETDKKDLPIVELYRDKILSILNKYVRNANDKIFTDYVEYLQSIELETKGYEINKIAKWSYLNYVGFFTKLLNEKIIHNEDDAYWDSGWGYVSNPKGGFNALWWIPYIRKDLRNEIRSDLYLQIENNKIALKLYNHDLEEKDNEEEIINKRWNLRYKITDYLDEKKFEHFQKGKRISISSRSTTFYFIEYDEKDYLSKIKYMENIFKEIIKII